MIAILLVKLFFWLASGIGRFLLDRLRFGRSGALSDQPLERFLFSCAIGLGIAGYGVYVIGLAGYLSFWPITIWWLLLGVVGCMGILDNFRDLIQIVKSGRSWIVNSIRAGRSEKRMARLIVIACSVLLVFTVIGTLACFRAPGPFEWDAISYHLADPKLFLMVHRISSLPTEHHSNFPFLLEMLFLVGLMYHGYALANLFHLGMAILTLLCLIAFGIRYFHPLVGWLAALAFFTVPIVFWEATIAYIDLGLALYLTMASFALTSALGIWSSGTPGETSNARGSEWVWLAGIAMGFALAMKYLALVPLGLMALVLVWKGWNGRAGARVRSGKWLQDAAAFVVISLAIGSPWYVKNIIVTGNPVYPFYYRAFPRSLYWSADRAASYQSEQDKFGTKPRSIDARMKLVNLLSVPWHILIQRQAVDVKDDLLYCNPGEFTFTALYGGLFAALCFPLAFLRRVPERIRILIWLGLGQIAAWFVLSQVGRYLIQIMPVFALAGAYTVVRMAFGEFAAGAGTRSYAKSGSNSATERSFWLPGWLGIGMIFAQAVYVLFSVCTLPMTVSYTEALEMRQQGRLPSAISLPTLFAKLGANPSLNPGLEVWKDDLHHHFNAYDAIEFINSQIQGASAAKTRPGAEDGVVLYEETRGFYLDTPYLWGNTQHSSYIPYETFKDGTDLVAWMRAHGIRYYLINLLQSGAIQARLQTGQGALGVEQEAFRLWVAEPGNQSGAIRDPADRVRALVGDAVERGLLRVEFANHGCIVLHDVSG